MASALHRTDDLNALGRGVSGLGWFVANIRLRRVSILIMVLMGALFTAGLVGTLSSFRAVGEINSVWRAFDTGLARRMVLLSELRQHLGFGGLMQHFHDYLLTADPLLKQAITTDLAKLKEVGPAYVTAGASAEEKQALGEIYGVVDAYERALPQVVEAVEHGDGAAKAHALGNIAEAPAIAALDRLGQSLKQEHRISADRVDDASWTVRATVTLVMSLNGLLLAALAAFFYWFTRFRIVRPLNALGGVMGFLAKGDKSVAVPLVEKTDEIGDMARAVEVFKESMIRTDELEAQKRAADQAVMERARRREQLTDQFGASASRLLGAVESAVEQVRGSAQSVAEVADRTGQQAQAVTLAADEASANVQAVASATEQLGVSGRHISQSVSQSADITRKAVTGIEALSSTMGALDQAADKIGEIVSLIGEIAAQTNLLALNASIEAQRAGEAGKGFAVVANEVKVLAGQTARATDEIAEQVNSIQHTTAEAVGALKAVGTVILEADEVVSSIASAVQEQNAATDSIVRNVTEAAAGNQRVSHSIADVSAAAEHTGQMATRMVDVTGALQGEADTMKETVEAFLAAVRST